MSTGIKLASLFRKLGALSGPALLVGLVMIGPVYGLAGFPGVTRLERSVNTILSTERQDILRQAQLITSQNTINRDIAILNQQLQNTTDLAEIARLERQIAAKQAQSRSVQVAITRNTVLLRRDLNVLQPQKDLALARLAGLKRPHPVNQIRQFVISAREQERVYTEVIRKFLERRPLSPTTPL